MSTDRSICETTPAPVKPELIPEAVIRAYVARYPHLRHLGECARLGQLQAAIAFARIACGGLEIPPGVTVRQIMALADVAGDK